MGRREVVAAAAALGVLALAVLGSFVLDGGFMMDDWTNAAIAQSATGPLDLVRDYRQPGVPSANHVAFCVTFALQFGLLGEHDAAHLLALLAVSVGMALAFFAVLRAVGVPALHAVALGALVLLFPAADSARLWPTMASNSVAVTLWLLGVLAALRGLTRGSRRWHVAAFGLYLLSVVLYELTAAPVVLSAAVYLLVAPPRRVLPRWVADVAAAGVGLAIFQAVIGRQTSGTVGDWLTHAWDIVAQIPDLLAVTLWPFGGLPALLALAIVLAVVALGAVRRDRRGLTAVALGVIGIVAGYVLLVPAEDFYVPLYPGHGNRVNLLASFGYVVLLYGLALILAAVRREAAVAVAVAAVVIGAGYAVATRDDADRWARAHQLAAQTLSGLARTVPKPPPGVTVYVTGQPGGRVAEGVPVFDWRFDLTGAVKLLWDDPTVAGYPILQGTRIVCEPDRLHPEGNGLDLNHGARYGFAIFADVKSGRRVGIDDRAECERESRRLAPAPLYVTD